MTEHQTLSAAGEARRDRMLGVLHEAMRTRIRRRRAIKVGAVALVLMASGALAFAIWNPRLTPSRTIVTAPPEAAPLMRFASFRFADTTQPTSIKPIDDDELLLELRAIGHPTGMIRVGPKVTLTGFKPKENEAGTG